MSKHTPGPWIQAGPSFGDDKPRWTSSIVTDFTDVCDNDVTIDDEIICEFPLTEYNEEQEANARLIAAAPELLEALDALRTELFFHAGGNYFRPLLDKAGDALMKARGEI